MPPAAAFTPNLPCKAPSFRPAAPAVTPVMPLDRHGKISKKRSRGFRMSQPSLASSSKQKFYAVQCGREGYSGVLNTWDECKFYVHGVKGAVFKSFNTYEEALVFSTLRHNASEEPQHSAVQRDSIDDVASTLHAASDDVIDLEADDWQEQARHSGIAQKLPIARAKIAAPPPRPKRITVYTDGACSNNGQWNSLAGYGVYFGEDSPHNISEPLPGPATNQRAEMMAVLEALRTVLAHQLVTRGGFVQIRTDSQYTKQGIESWVENWKKNGWKSAAGKPVKNKDLWMALDKTRITLLESGVQLELVWVKGHAGCPGNEAADHLATQGAKRAVR